MNAKTVFAWLPKTLYRAERQDCFVFPRWVKVRRAWLERVRVVDTVWGETVYTELSKVREEE